MYARGGREKRLLTVNPVNPLVFLFPSLSLFFSLSLSYHQYFLSPYFCSF